jgi:hypothetical protein
MAVTLTNSRLIFSFENSASKRIRSEIDFIDGTFQVKDSRFSFGGVCEEILQ